MPYLSAVQLISSHFDNKLIKTKNGLVLLPDTQMGNRKQDKETTTRTDFRASPPQQSRLLRRDK